jgi:hypothetical protein
MGLSPWPFEWPIVTGRNRRVNRSTRGYNRREMRRAGRYILDALAVVSLLLCAGALVLWVRSYRIGDWARVTRAPGAASWVDTTDPSFPLPMGTYHQVHLRTSPGRVDLKHVDYDDPYLPAIMPERRSDRRWDWRWDTEPVAWDIDRLDHYTVSWRGFGLDWGTHGGLMMAERHVHGVRLPLWFVVLACGLFAGARLRRVIKRRRRPGSGFAVVAQP